MEDILDNPNLRVNVIDIVDSSISTENILVKLMAIYNDKIDSMCHGETTHMLVMYDQTIIVAGALLRVTSKCVVIKRVCSCVTSPELALKIIQCLQYLYSNTELHLSAVEEKTILYKEVNFMKRNRRNCLCKHRKGVEHIVWNYKPSRVVTRQQKGARIRFQIKN